MILLVEVIQFVFFSGLIVIISKEILVKTLRKLAESLKLKPKTVGNIAGIATSVPELLTISVSSFNGLIDASIYNVLSSNIINFIQYSVAIILNKNQRAMKNKAIKVDVILVIITIITPILFIVVKSELQLTMVPIFILIYICFRKINNNVHKLYLNNENIETEKNIIRYAQLKKEDKKNIIKNIIILIITAILLFVIGNLLGNSLEVLCVRFNIPEFIIGIFLGFVTSIPELITFFEAQRHHKKSENNMIGVIEATNNLFMSNTLNLFVIESVGILIYSILSLIWIKK